MAFACLILGALFSSSNAAEIESNTSIGEVSDYGRLTRNPMNNYPKKVLRCEPPDLPLYGGYGPKKTDYMPGDIIHYYCEVDTFIGGNFYRKCLDTGDWSLDTPVCDAPSAFKAIFQSTDMDDDGTAQAAIDGIRTTCTETIGGEREEWSGNFTQKGELIRVMLFLPKGPANLEVVLVKENGDEVVCGKHRENMDRFDWTIVGCRGPNNLEASGLQIRSLTNDPLKICEIQAYVLTSPKCTDPHHHIESGRLKISRKTATLVCDKGYTRGPDTKLECVREGEWNRKALFCVEDDWEDREALDKNEERSPSPPRRYPETERHESV